MKALLIKMSTLNLIGGSVFELQTRNQNVDSQIHKQMDALTSYKAESKLAQVVSYHPVKFKTDVSVKVWKTKC